ncbi:MAG: hypothetical protein DYH04_01955 [Nitrospira sp. NTP2]|nr:hypothetical protein [Nitrospira sp. NTP2]RIK57808.1 MAG: hypothetical protein DCC63_12575 [Nitrospira sp.]
MSFDLKPIPCAGLLMLQLEPANLRFEFSSPLSRDGNYRLSDHQNHPFAVDLGRYRQVCGTASKGKKGEQYDEAP